MTPEIEKIKTKRKKSKQTLHTFIVYEYHILPYISVFQDLIKTDIHHQKNIVPYTESQ